MPLVRLRWVAKNVFTRQDFRSILPLYSPLAPPESSNNGSGTTKEEEPQLAEQSHPEAQPPDPQDQELRQPDHCTELEQE